MLRETDFINRHIGPRKLETEKMLKIMGLKNIEELIEEQETFTGIDLMWKTVHRYTMLFKLHFGNNRFA